MGRIDLNHTIVYVKNKQESARFLTELFDLPDPKPLFGGHFLEVRTSNGVSLDFCESNEVHWQHYAFLVSEETWDAIFSKLQSRGLVYWSDPGQKNKGQFNTNDGGKGVYFEDPSGHLLEILTVPYGGGEKSDGA